MSKQLTTAKYAHYCGPAALASIAGVPPLEAAELLDSLRGNPGEGGTWTSDIVKALRALGFVCETFRPRKHWSEAHEAGRPENWGWGVGDYRANSYVEDRYTVAQWLRTEQGQEGTWLVVASRHYVVAQDGELVEHNGLPTKRGRVRTATLVTAPGGDLNYKAAPAPRQETKS